MKKITMNISNVKTVKEGFKEFIQYCKVKNLSEKTIKNYYKAFDYFTDFYDWNNEVADITQQTVLQFTLHLQENYNMQSVESINTWLRYMRSVFNYWAELGYMKKVKVTLQKGEEKIKETYSDAELKILLKKPDLKKCTFTEYRTWMIINFLLGTGCRVRTLVNIKIGDLDLENMLVKYTTTKNRRQQIIPITVSLQKVLVEYLKYRGGEVNDYLFPSENNTKLLETTINHSVNKYHRARGITKTGVHRYRHTFAKNWILAGGDPFSLKTILGHSDMQIVSKYVNMFSDDLKNNFSQFNPLERFSNSSHIKLRK